MKSLKYKENAFKVVEYSDIDKFISSVYGINYESAVYQEWTNCSCYRFNVEKKELDAYDKKRFNDGKYEYLLADLLDDCCSRGLIEPGEYLIDVYW